MGVLALLGTGSRIPGTMGSDEVHLWAWDLQPEPAELAADRKLLDDRERERMERFRFAIDADRYAKVHANVRRILAPYVNQTAQELRFRIGEFGKPELDGDTSLRFSLSHSHTTALLAVDAALPVGVDVEDVRPLEAEVAERHFSALELSMLCPLQGDDWLNSFYRCWTRKEAILKAEGLGLFCDLDSFDVSLLPGQKAELIASRRRLSYPWRLHDVSPSSGIIAALATARPNARIIQFVL